jgi:hypothetical protein
MALSVIMLLSIALVKTFENRTIETVHLANSLQRFQAETLSRSIFRALLLTVKTKGLLFVEKNRLLWQGVPVPLNDGQYFQIKEIKPIDHLFNLNRKFLEKEKDLWPVVFANIVNRYKLAQDPLAPETTTDDVKPILSAINDWTDPDDDPDTEFLYNNEAYRDAIPEFLVKNRGLDRLSELKLLPAFQELGFKEVVLKNKFRIFPVENDSNKQFIDINLAAPEEVEQFLEQFENVEKYPNLFDSRTAISGILEARDEELAEQQGEGGILDPKSRFSSLARGSQWETKLEQAGVKLNAETGENEFFSTRTKLVAISFSVTVLRVTINTEAIVETDYESTTDNNLNIKSFTILQYSMR